MANNLFLTPQSLGRLANSIPARSANWAKASGNSIPSFFIRNPKISPPKPQPKQCQICLSGLTIKEGSLSEWKGQTER